MSSLYKNPFMNNDFIGGLLLFNGDLTFNLPNLFFKDMSVIMILIKRVLGK